MAEFALLRDEKENTPFREALVVFAGNGSAGEGQRQVRLLQRRQVNNYLSRLAAVGVDRSESINRRLKEWLL